MAERVVIDKLIEITNIYKVLMNKRVIDWNNYEKDFKKRFAEKDLKDSKRNSIAYIEDIDKLTTWKIYHAHWEDYFSSSYYFKNWRKKINSFQTEKEVNFYTDRLRVFIEFVEKYTRKDINNYSGRVIEDAKPWDPVNTSKLIEQELKRLENISEEEFNKMNKWKKSTEFKELSAKEMLNDPWFSKEIDNIFGLENGKLPKEEKPVEKDSNGDINYQTWTKEQLISEINRLKAENEQLKNNQTLTTSERQERLQQNQQKLEQIANYVSVDSKPTNSNNNFPTSLVIGGGVLATVGLIGLLITRKKKKK